MLKKIVPVFVIAASFFALTTKSAFAQVSGCVDSPEDPTVVMALLGGAAALTPLVWSKVRARRRHK
jgi:XrtJ-associated TM-motif-TM protein